MLPQDKMLRDQLSESLRAAGDIIERSAERLDAYYRAMKSGAMSPEKFRAAVIFVAEQVAFEVADEMRGGFSHG